MTKCAQAQLMISASAGRKLMLKLLEMNLTVRCEIREIHLQYRKKKTGAQFQRLGFKVLPRKTLLEHGDHDTILLGIQLTSLESRRQYQAALFCFQLAHETAHQHPEHFHPPNEHKPHTATANFLSAPCIST